MSGYRPFDPSMIDQDRVYPREQVYAAMQTADGEMKYLSGYCRGEEVSPETYKVYLDTLYRDHPAFDIEFNPQEEKGSYMVLYLHKEDIYVDGK